MENYLKNIYYDVSNPVSFGGVYKLYKQAKKDGHNYTIKDITKWLQTQDTYTIFKPIRRKFQRPRVVVSQKDGLWMADSVYMDKWYKYNNGFKYFVLIIDVFTRWAWAVPLKTLTSEEVTKAFLKILKTRKCSTLVTDNGSEFRGKFEKMLEHQGVKHVRTKNEDTKAVYAERLVKTIKTKLTRNMYHRQTYDWVNFLPKAIHSYNYR